MLRTSFVARCTTAAAATINTPVRTQEIIALDPDICLRDTLLRELRPLQLRVDFPVLASMAQSSIDERLLSSGAVSFQGAARRSLHASLPHSMRVTVPMINRLLQLVLLAAEPKSVMGSLSDDEVKALLADHESTRKMWRILFDEDNSAVPIRDLRREIVRDVVLPFVHDRFLVSVLKLQQLTGWHRFAHLLVGYTSLQQALVESHEAVVAAPGVVVSAQPAVWARRLNALVDKDDSPSSSPSSPSSSPSSFRLIGDVLRFGGGGEAGTTTTRRAGFLPPSLAQLLRPEGKFRSELRGLGFEVSNDLLHQIVEL